MECEYNALHKNNTWCLVNATSDMKIVDSKWVYKIKKNVDGQIKYKARLVARGFTQRYGENYWDTYAPVVKCSTIKMLLARSLEDDMMVDQIDIRNAYVKSDLKECIYMKQPKGFELGNNMVCKLNKSLYGLKQAGYEWNKCLNDFLTEDLKFQRLMSDPCVYKRIYKNYIFIIIEFKNKMNIKFEIEDLGECQRIIGIDVQKTEAGIRIQQKKFIEQLLEEYNMMDCKIEKTPLNTTIELTCNIENCKSDCKLIDSTLYRGIIGKLLYLAGSTRPDIAFTISSLSRFNNNPHTKHWEAAKRVLRYLKGTMNYVIEYTKRKEKLFAYSDPDYGNCLLDRKSYTGFVVFLAGAPIAWEARKQPKTALSTVEAEYMAVTSTAKEILFCKKILQELNYNEYCSGPIKLYSDNLGAIKLS